jgi:hypothetical protein
MTTKIPFSPPGASCFIIDPYRFCIITEWTVRTPVSNILGKLHLAIRTQAALYALRSGLASIDDVPAAE